MTYGWTRSAAAELWVNHKIVCFWNVTSLFFSSQRSFSSHSVHSQFCTSATKSIGKCCGRTWDLEDLPGMQAFLDFGDARTQNGHRIGWWQLQLFEGGLATIQRMVGTPPHVLVGCPSSVAAHGKPQRSLSAATGLAVGNVAKLLFGAVCDQLRNCFGHGAV